MKLGAQHQGLITAYAHDSLDAMKINYDVATTDQIPFSILLNLGNLPKLLPVDSNISAGKLDWSTLTKEDLKEYNFQTDTLLGSIELPKNAIVYCDYGLQELATH